MTAAAPDPGTGPSPAAVTSDIVVRRAVPDDLDTVIGLNRDYCAADHHDFDPVTARAGFEPLLDGDGHGVVFVAEDTSGVVGYAVVTWGWSVEVGGPDMVLDEIYSRVRGRGVGTALVARVETECRERHAERIMIETERPNRSARRLYERHGFVTETSIWMSKELR